MTYDQALTNGYYIVVNQRFWRASFSRGVRYLANGTVLPLFSHERWCATGPHVLPSVPRGKSKQIRQEILVEHVASGRAKALEAIAVHFVTWRVNGNT